MASDVFIFPKQWKYKLLSRPSQIATKQENLMDGGQGGAH
jgi:hypothetical protein